MLLLLLRLPVMCAHSQMLQATANDWYAAVVELAEPTGDLKKAVNQVLGQEWAGVSYVPHSTDVGKNNRMVCVAHTPPAAGYVGSCHLLLRQQPRVFLGADDDDDKQLSVPALEVLQQREALAAQPQQHLTVCGRLHRDANRQWHLTVDGFAPCRGSSSSSIHQQLVRGMWTAVGALLLWLFRPTPAGAAARLWYTLGMARPQLLLVKAGNSMAGAPSEQLPATQHGSVGGDEEEVVSAPSGSGKTR